MPHDLPPSDRLHVALFAGMAAAAGTRSLELPWRGGTVADLRRLVGQSRPEIAALLGRSAVAVGDRYADDDSPVPPGADVAILPPVSGG